MMTSEQREHYGRLVRETWVKYCLETGDTKPSHIAPWEQLSEWDKEADRRIAEALLCDVLADLDAARDTVAAVLDWRRG